MSFIKISQLPSATGITPDDYLVMVDNPNISATTKKVAFQQVSEAVLSDLDTTLIAGSGIIFDYNSISGTLTINANIDGGNI